jgi:hypothetical protein
LTLPWGTLPPLVLGGIIENENSDFSLALLVKKIIFRLRNGRETLEQKKEQRIYMHKNIAHARAVAIKQRPIPCFFTQRGPKKTS